MKRLSSTLFVVMLALSLLFSATASAATNIVSYGGTYSGTLSSGQADSYILPNARTSGTSVKITTSAANTLQVHYYWSYNNTTIDLGTYVVNSTTYNSGSAYYQAGTLVTVVERVPGSTTPYPTVSYTISFN